MFSRFLLSLLAFVLLSACTTTESGRSAYHHTYHKVKIMDYRNALIAQWIAEGTVWPYGRGYRFKAVERTSGLPYSVTTHYPLGRMVFVDGPHITVAPCGKPEWLYEMDHF